MTSEQSPSTISNGYIAKKSSVVPLWVNTVNYPEHFDLSETVKKRFDAEGASSPCPQQDVHRHQAGHWIHLDTAARYEPL